MGFLKFVFVLLLVVPVAVLMLYFVSNLSDKMKISIKNQKNNDSSADRKVQESAMANRQAKIAIALFLILFFILLLLFFFLLICDFNFANLI